MSLEKSFERIADALESIAARYNGAFQPDPEPETETPKPDKKPRSRGKKEETIGKSHEVDDSISKEDVRAKLQAVQKATTPAQAKSILKALGATTIGNLAKSKYALAIEQCNTLLDDNDIPY